MRATFVACAAAVLMLSACGGDDDGAETDPTETTEAGAEPTSSDGEGTAAPGGDDWCDLAREFDADYGAADLPTSDPEALEAFVRGAQEALAEMAEAPPAELGDSIDLILAPYEPMIAALDDADWDWSTFISAPGVDTIIPNPDERDEAESDFNDYLEETCGIEEPDTTEPDGELGFNVVPEELMNTEALAAYYVDGGLDPDRAACLADELLDGAMADGVLEDSDQDAFDAALEQCGLTMDELKALDLGS